MSACRVAMANCGIVASTAAASTPARGDASRQATSPTNAAPVHPASMLGSRIAISGQGERTISDGSAEVPTPKTFIDSAISQNMSGGLLANVFSVVPLGPVLPACHHRSIGSWRTRTCRATSP
ncbi:MAG TPA: hypothetical protein VFG69_13475 [Nannocystaceae bacterium]|nr:hypothetical protein [Nannocystaceae bacterium]